MLKIILLGLTVLIVIVSAITMLQPDSYRVERSIKIKAQAENVYSHIADLRKWPAWSPWAKRDPGMKMTFSEVTTGVGAWAAWDSQSEGQGKQTISEVIENHSLKINLEFFAPFQGQASSDLTIESMPDTDVVLTWGMDGHNNGFVEKAFYLLMNFDKMIGTDYETGLQAIKVLSENTGELQINADIRPQFQPLIRYNRDLTPIFPH